MTVARTIVSMEMPMPWFSSYPFTVCGIASATPCSSADTGVKDHAPVWRRDKASPLRVWNFEKDLNAPVSPS